MRIFTGHRYRVGDVEYVAKSDPPWIALESSPECLAWEVLYGHDRMKPEDFFQWGDEDPSTEGPVTTSDIRLRDIRHVGGMVSGVQQ